MTDHIRIVGARQHTLRGIDLEIPRRAITVFTGVSGSGKTSLVFDTIAAEAQSQLNETFPAFVRNRMPSYGRPDVDLVENLSPVVVVDQRRLGANARSTVGTITDIAPLLRLLFSRAGTPRIGESTAFSFNDPAGMCERCSGLGEVVTPAPESFLDDGSTLAEGAIRLPGFGNTPGQARYWYRKYAETGCFDVDLLLRDWPAERRELLLHGGPELPVEGLVDHFVRIYLQAEGEMSARKQATIDRFSTRARCPDCDGARLNARARSVTVAGRTFTEWCAVEVAELVDLVRTVPEPAPVVDLLAERLAALDEVGLGYLTLDRPTGTLSGGEAQRVKTVRHLASSLIEMLVVFDEPTVGLHPRDVERLTGLLRRLRDRGNTVLVVEHARDVIAVADHVVDLGPGAGPDGGAVLVSGSLADLRAADTPTGRALRAGPAPVVGNPRTPTGWLPIRGADRNTLRSVDVDVPTGVLTAITGVAGSGKSSLVDVLVEQHPGVVRLDQSGLTTSRRSSLATYTGIAVDIRKRFARAHGVPVSRFSANSGGACPDCDGLGVQYTDLAFLAGVSTPCPTCRGRRFSEEVLAMTVDGRSIADELDRTVDDAREAFPTMLGALADVGLGHLTLGRPTSTFSGGERQRLRLALELARGSSSGTYVLDEPTTGLHPTDVDRLVGVFDGLVDAGHTVIVVEHDLDVIARADHVIDLGPGAGRLGGTVVFTGPPSGASALRPC
ncbi:ATP-binding cassette domain-containing protein [Actinomycetospora termitidis]|uniref:UvrABC system protein A n=1 Tax=Actinomycetospora termitidis TaxID=3053470 RepID=A0ABT7M379_9PSEU|nr:ATP-binding cassette domain-containing protein [Actinomycetospora sp. Odt1-22]MDL5155123.1 ATP-binding cassette domain-containing protein [Actinomycetospora sp. Odt1-22]